MSTTVNTERSSRRKINNNDSNQEKNESINGQSNVNNGSGGVKRANKRKSTTNAVRMRQEQNNNTTNTNDHANKNVQFAESDSKKPKLDTKTEMFEKYQPWVIKTYGDLSKTKTVTVRKYSRILKTLRGEEVNSADSSKFRFWVKAKGFHVGRPDGYDAKPADTIVGRYSVCDFDDAGQNELIESQIQQEDVTTDVCGSAKDPPLYVPTVPVKNATPVGAEPVYRKVAVVENFFDIIYSVHVELEGRPGKHAGQKRTYRTITETYAFLPREAVTRFLLGCTDCQRRPRSLSPAPKLSPAVGRPPSEQTNVARDTADLENGSDAVGCYLADKANTSTFDDKRINFGSVASFVNDGDGTAQANAVVSSTVMRCGDAEIENGDCSSDKSKNGLAAVDLTSKDTTKSNSNAKTTAEQNVQNSGYLNNNAKYIFPYFPLCNFSGNNDYQKTFEKSLLQNQNNFKVISDQATFDKDTKFKSTIEPKKKSSNPLDVCNLTSQDPPKKSNLKKFLPMMNGNFCPNVKQETVFTDFTKPWSPISRIYPSESVNKNGQLSEPSRGVSIFASMAASKKVSDIKQEVENSHDNNAPCKFEPADFNRSPSGSRSSDFRMLGGEIDYSLPITTTYLKHMRSLGYSDEEALKLERSQAERLYSFHPDPITPGPCSSSGGGVGGVGSVYIFFPHTTAGGPSGDFDVGVQNDRLE